MDLKIRLYNLPGRTWTRIGPRQFLQVTTYEKALSKNSLKPKWKEIFEKYQDIIRFFFFFWLCGRGRRVDEGRGGAGGGHKYIQNWLSLYPRN